MIYPVTVYNAECEVCRRDFTELLDDEPVIFIKEEEIKIALFKNGWHVDGKKTICDNCYKFDERGNLVLNPYKPYKPKPRVRRRPSPDNEDAN